MSGRGPGLRWYFKRLRVMGPAELLHRAQEQWVISRLRLGQAVTPRRPTSVRHLEPSAFCTATAPQLPPLPWAFDPDSVEIERLLAGSVSALATSWVWRDDPGVWHEAPDTGKAWPRAFFSTIPYRAGNPYGDARVVWEPSRLQQLIPLGLLAARRTDETGRQAADLLARQLDSWVAGNPPYVGVHYVSVMECGLRLMAACHAVDLARARFRETPRVWTALVVLVDSHARLIEGRLSQYSSAGNHTIAECAGLVYAGTVFPELDGANEWRSLGLSILEREAPRQILRDGGGSEQALWYLAFIVDLFGLVTALLRHREQVVPHAIRFATTQGRDFLAAFAGDPTQLPAIGDADHGYALSPYLRLSWRTPREPAPARTTFSTAGYSILRRPAPGNAILCFDHGPLGLAPSYGHGHADALSVVLRWRGEDVLIDPGTYSYAGDSAWRAYFRSTAAHNTVTVDETDQALQETAFQWAKPYAAELVHAERHADGRVALLARHAGYRRLGVEHWRGVFAQPGDRWLVWDYLTGRGTHRLDLHWHLGVEAVARPEGVLLSGLRPTATLVVSGGTPEVFRGETAPIMGWRSRTYGHKAPCATLRVRVDGLLPREFVTRLGYDETGDRIDHEDVVKEFRRWVARASSRERTSSHI